MSLINAITVIVALYFVMVLVQAFSLWRTQSLSTLASPRDAMVDKGVFAGRCRRANFNMMEGMLMFFPLAFVALHTNPLGALAVTGATLFVVGRLLYAPLYWFGISFLRTVAWAISIVGLVLMFIQIIPV